MKFDKEAYKSHVGKYRTEESIHLADNIHDMPKDQRPKRRNIDPAEWIVNALTHEAIDKGFRGFKPYAEHILEEAAKKVLAKKEKKAQ